MGGPAAEPAATPAPVPPTLAPARGPADIPAPVPAPVPPALAPVPVGPVVLPRRRRVTPLVAANAYPAAATEAARIPVGEFLGLWLGFPALLAGLAYVGYAMVLLAQPDGDVRTVLWPVWLAVTLGLQVPYWAALTGRPGMALTAALPGIGLVTTYQMARGVLAASQRWRG